MKKDRIVVKVGSNVLTREDGSPDITMISSIVDQIVGLREKGYDVILVTSGAVACGRRLLKHTGKMDEVEQRQLFSAMGQVRLINLYFSLFRDYGYNIGQVLTMKESFSTKRQYQNQKGCMEIMLRNGVIPIVNENDTVCVTELMFTDNDELSGLVAEMMGAHTLIILTNVDGLYDGDPGEEGSEVIRHILPGEDISCHIASSKSSRGRGGMKSKCTTAASVAAKGVRVVIANGRRENIITDIMDRPDEAVFTEFVPAV